MKKHNVAVVMGGVSPEHDISIRSGATVLEFLPEEKYRCMAVVIQPSGGWCLKEGPHDEGALKKLTGAVRPEIALAKLMAWEIDVAFLALHGPNGEDGSVQGFFQAAGIPYTGSGVEASAASMNKYTSKILASWAGIKTPPALLLGKHDWERHRTSVLEKPASEFGYPVYVKTLRSGSSIGVHRVAGPQALEAALDAAFTLDEEVIIEQGMEGREITCGVIHRAGIEYEALPPVEIKPKGHSFFNFESKYDASQADEICPALISEAETASVKKASEDISRRIGTRGICRIDFILNEEGLWFLELNAIPGLTRESIVLKEAEAAGIPLGQLMDRLVQSALSEHEIRQEGEMGWP
jgi:D-alanine-D-alanine ligase